MTDEEKMRFALNEAVLAYSEGEVPVGAALFKGDTLIVSSHNLCVSLHDPTAHAEMISLQSGAKALGSLRDCSLYVTLEPCAMCAGAIVNTQLGHLIYGAFDSTEGCCGSLIDLTDHWLSHSCKTVGGILQKECSDLLSSFFKNKH